jgi:hypothetical protein
MATPGFIRHPPDEMLLGVMVPPRATLTMWTVAKTRNREMIFGGCSVFATISAANLGFYGIKTMTLYHVE